MTVPIHDERDQAREALAYIRQTMESASGFTAVSGWGLAGVGVVGLIAWVTADRLGDVLSLSVWVPAATLAIALAMVANAWKASQLDVSLWSGAFRKLAWVMAPVLMAGAVLTYALDGAGQAALLPGAWLVIYGAGVTAGGTLSVRAIRGMGVLLSVMGAVALIWPEFGPVLLPIGFGLVHIVFGIYLIRRHGG